MTEYCGTNCINVPHSKLGARSPRPSRFTPLRIQRTPIMVEYGNHAVSLKCGTESVSGALCGGAAAPVAALSDSAVCYCPTLSFVSWRCYDTASAAEAKAFNVTHNYR